MSERFFPNNIVRNMLFNAPQTPERLLQEAELHLTNAENRGPAQQPSELEPTGIYILTQGRHAKEYLNGILTAILPAANGKPGLVWARENYAKIIDPLIQRLAMTDTVGEINITGKQENIKRAFETKMKPPSAEDGWFSRQWADFRFGLEVEVEAAEQTGMDLVDAGIQKANEVAKTLAKGLGEAANELAKQAFPWGWLVGGAAAAATAVVVLVVVKAD